MREETEEGFLVMIWAYRLMGIMFLGFFLVAKVVFSNDSANTIMVLSALGMITWFALTVGYVTSFVWSGQRNNRKPAGRNKVLRSSGRTLDQRRLVKLPELRGGPLVLAYDQRPTTYEL